MKKNTVFALMMFVVIGFSGGAFAQEEAAGDAGDIIDVTPIVVASGGPGYGPGYGMRGGKGMGPGRGYGSNYMNGRGGFNSPMADFHQDAEVIQLRDQMQKKRVEMLTLMQAEKVDDQKVQSVHREIMALRDRMSDKRISAVLEFKEKNPDWQPGYRSGMKGRGGYGQQAYNQGRGRGRGGFGPGHGMMNRGRGSYGIGRGGYGPGNGMMNNSRGGYGPGRGMGPGNGPWQGQTNQTAPQNNE